VRIKSQYIRSFRSIGSFSTPLPLVYSKRKQSISSDEKDIDGEVADERLYQLEEDLSKWIRNSTCSRKSRKKRPYNSEGTYVVISWIDENKARHLIFDVRIDHEQAAQILFCFPRYCSSEEYEAKDRSKIYSFAFAMVRGTEIAFRPVLQWFQSFHGHVSKNPFLFSPFEVAHASVTWTLQDRNESDSSSFLEITFALPPNLSNGLQTITITIPPVSLCQLYNTANLCRKQENTTIRPILKSLEAFMYETFHIDIRTFTIVKTSSPGLVFMSCDGRFKPMSIKLLPYMLTTIKDIFESRILSKG